MNKLFKILIISIFTLTINAEGGFTILETSPDVVEPETWNQFYPDDIGYGCDWSEGGGGRKYKL